MQMLACHINGGILLKQLNNGDKAAVLLFLLQNAVEVLKGGTKIFELGCVSCQRLQSIRIITAAGNTRREKFLKLHHIPYDAILCKIENPLSVASKTAHNAILSHTAAFLKRSSFCLRIFVHLPSHLPALLLL